MANDDRTKRDDAAASEPTSKNKQEPIGFVSTAKVRPDQSKDTHRPSSSSGTYKPESFKDPKRLPGIDKKKRITLIVVCALACGVLAVALSNLAGAGREPEVVVRDVATAAVTRKDFKRQVEATGTIEPSQTTNVTSEVDGVIETIEVREGQSVHEGDVLLTIKNDTLENGVNEAKRSLETAQLTYDTAKADAEKARGAYDEAVRVYKAAYAAYKKDLAAYEETIESANEGEPVAPTPIDESTATPAEKEEYKRLYDEYVKALVAYNAAVASASSAVKPQEPTFDESTLLTAIENSDKVLESADLALKNAQTALEEAEKTAEKRTVKSPVDGTVVDVAAKTGTRIGAAASNEKVSNNDALVQIGDLSSLIVKAEVTENDLKLVKIGQKAKVSVKAADVNLDAEVSDIANKSRSKDAAGNALFTVELTVPISDPKAKQGMTAKTKILIETIKNALVVPVSALTSQDGSSATVEVITNPETKAGEERKVTIGASDGAEVVITEGLAEGDEVVVPEPVEAAEEKKES